MKQAKTPTLIGRREYISFPELGLDKIEAKIDTGAYTSALHCHDIVVKEVKGKKVLSFKTLDPSHPNYTGKEVIVTEYYLKSIKNSFGETEQRYIITTSVVIGNRKVKSRFSLTDRGTMRYQVLIGRRLLKNRFTVDVGKKHIG